MSLIQHFEFHYEGLLAEIYYGQRNRFKDEERTPVVPRMTGFEATKPTEKSGHSRYQVKRNTSSKFNISDPWKLSGVAKLSE